MSYAIRITRSYNEVSEWVEAIPSTKIVVFQHDADGSVQRTHVHMYVETTLKPDAMKARYKKVYNQIDKGDWSFKTATEDADKYITYMSKGVLDPKFVVGFEEDKLNELKSKWIDPKATKVVLQDGKLVKQTKEITAPTKRQMLEEMIATIGEGTTTRETLVVIRKILMKYNQVIGQYKMMDYYDSIVMYSKPESWMYSMEKLITRKYDGY
jgi:hypothetical protein